MPHFAKQTDGESPQQAPPQPRLQVPPLHFAPHWSAPHPFEQMMPLVTRSQAGELVSTPVLTVAQVPPLTQAPPKMSRSPVNAQRLA